MCSFGNSLAHTHTQKKKKDTCETCVFFIFFLFPFLFSLRPRGSEGIAGLFSLSLSFFFFFNFTKRGIWRGWESRSRPLFLSYQLFSFSFLLLLFISPSFSRNKKGKKKKNEELKAHLTFFLFYFIVASIPITLGEIKTGKEAKDEQRWQSLYKGASNVELVVVIRHYFPPALFFFSSFHNLL